MELKLFLYHKIVMFKMKPQACGARSPRLLEFARRSRARRRCSLAYAALHARPRELLYFYILIV